MSRIEEFGMMLDAIDEADYWDAYPHYWERLCDWYDIDIHDVETYDDPEVLFNVLVDAYHKDKEECERRDYELEICFNNRHRSS